MLALLDRTYPVRGRIHSLQLFMVAELCSCCYHILLSGMTLSKQHASCHSCPCFAQGHVISGVPGSFTDWTMFHAAERRQCELPRLSAATRGSLSGGSASCHSCPLPPLAHNLLIPDMCKCTYGSALCRRPLSLQRDRGTALGAYPGILACSSWRFVALNRYTLFGAILKSVHR